MAEPVKQPLGAAEAGQQLRGRAFPAGAVGQGDDRGGPGGADEGREAVHEVQQAARGRGCDIVDRDRKAPVCRGQAHAAMMAEYFAV